jgi:thermitase
MKNDNGSGDGFSEHRTKEQLRADRANVRRQLAVLAPQGADRVDTLVARISSRQESAPAQYALPFDRYPVTGEDGKRSYVLVARGQLVVRVDPGPVLDDCDEIADGPDIPGLLAKLGYRPVDRKGRDIDPRTAVYQGRKKPAELAQDIEKLRGAEITATCNLIAPLGHLVKGDDLPYATSSLGTLPLTKAAGDVRIAVIDTGITAEDRSDNWLDVIVRSPDNTDPLDILPVTGPTPGDGRLDYCAGHGSFAAGIVQRVAPECEIVVYRFTRSDGLGTEKDVAEAILRAAEDARVDGVRLIINASLGTPAIDGVEPQAMRDAAQLIEDEYPDVLLVASAGNSGTAEPMYPAAFPGVVAVGALTDDMQPAAFSNFGPWLDCSTVGVGVVSTFVQGMVPPEQPSPVPDHTFPPDAWAIWTGTSFSAPQVSAAVAAACQKTPGQSPRDAAAALLAGKNTIPGYGSILRILPGTPS